MKTIISLVLAVAALNANAQVSVSGHVRSDGTYVQPHQRTAPNGTLSDNYSTRGNVNPYTGKAGTVVDQQSSYAVQLEQARLQQAQEFHERQQQQQYEQQQEVQRQIQRQQRLQEEQLMQAQRLQQLQQLQRMQTPQAPAYNINGGCNPNYPASCIGR